MKGILVSKVLVSLDRVDGRSENLRVHIVDQGLLKEQVLHLYLAKSEGACAPCTQSFAKPCLKTPKLDLEY